MTQPLRFKRLYTPLLASFNVAISEGSTHQFYHSNSNTYVPNRVIISLKLTPVMSVVDIDDGSLTGDVSKSLSVNWYENSTATLIASGEDYTVNTDGSLVVKKNVDVESPVQIICVAYYTDPRSGKQVKGEAIVPLSTTVKTDESVTVTIDKDVVTPYNPITAATSRIQLKASVRLGADEPPASNVAYWWYKVVDGVEHLVGSKITDIDYVSGAREATLTVEAQNTMSTLYRVRAAYFTDTEPSAPTDSRVYAETTVKWDVPAYDVMYSSDMGTRIATGMSTVKLRCYISFGKSVVEPEHVDDFFTVIWYAQSTKAGSTAVQIGHGAVLEVAVDKVDPGAAYEMEVYPEVKLLEAYRSWVNENGVIFTNEEGKIFIIR